MRHYPEVIFETSSAVSTETGGNLFDSTLVLYEQKTGAVRLPKHHAQHVHGNVEGCAVADVFVALLVAKLAAFLYLKVDGTDAAGVYSGIVPSVVDPLLVDELEFRSPLVVVAAFEIQKDLKPKTQICYQLLNEQSLLDP